jgi:hypothetical protein
MNATELRLDAPLPEDALDITLRWYESEVLEGPRPSMLDCFVVRGLRELKRSREALCHTHGVRGCTHPDHWGIPS